MKVGEIDLYLYNPCYRWSKRFSMDHWETIKGGSGHWVPGSSLAVSTTGHPLG
jgi:hypothetical protein